LKYSERLKDSQLHTARILIVAPQWIGDCVMAEPFMAQLREQHPASFIAAMAIKSVVPVLRSIAAVDEVIALPFAHGQLQWSERRKLAKQLATRHFNVAYVLPNSMKAALVPWLANIPRRVGYTGESRLGLLTQRLPNPKEKRPLMTEFYASLAGKLPAHETLPPATLHAQPAQRLSACAMHGITLEQPYIVLAPGAEYGPAKQWPTAHFRALAELAAAQQFATVVMGGAKDKSTGQTIAEGIPLAINLCGETSLDDAIAILSGAEGAVSNDSGLMHIAAALRVPTVGIYGSTSPHHTPPAAHRSATLWLGPQGAYGQPGVTCSPCFERLCRFEGNEHMRCLQGIAPKLAWDTLRRL
jgi:heptosyltransferase II